VLIGGEGDNHLLGDCPDAPPPGPLDRVSLAYFNENAERGSYLQVLNHAEMPTETFTVEVVLDGARQGRVGFDGVTALLVDRR